MVKKIRLVLLFGSIYVYHYFAFFCKTATCITCFLLLKITLFHTLQMWLVITARATSLFINSLMCHSGNVAGSNDVQGGPKMAQFLLNPWTP